MSSNRNAHAGTHRQIKNSPLPLTYHNHDCHTQSMGALSKHTLQNHQGLLNKKIVIFNRKFQNSSSNFTCFVFLINCVEVQRFKFHTHIWVCSSFSTVSTFSLCVNVLLQLFLPIVHGIMIIVSNNRLKIKRPVLSSLTAWSCSISSHFWGVWRRQT